MVAALGVNALFHIIENLVMQQGSMKTWVSWYVYVIPVNWLNLIQHKLEKLKTTNRQSYSSSTVDRRQKVYNSDIIIVIYCPAYFDHKLARHYKAIKNRNKVKLKSVKLNGTITSLQLTLKPVFVGSRIDILGSVPNGRYGLATSNTLSPNLIHVLCTV